MASILRERKCMTATVFVDTNVLIYAVDVGDRRKQALAEAWRRALWRTGRGRTSVQVLEEFYAKVTKKWPASGSQVRAEILDLFAWNPVPITTNLLELGWKVQDLFHFSFWDALIVAAAKLSGSNYLLTEDLQAGQDLDGVKIVNPFETNAHALIPELRVP